MSEQTEPVLIIAEAGVNHNGELALAHKLIDVAAEAGADIVKFQTFTADLVMRPDTPLVEYQKAGGIGDDMYELCKAIELPLEDFSELARHCTERGIRFLSTPFDAGSLAYLVDVLDTDIIKVASGETVNVPFLRDVARTGLPVIMSTGMCDMGDVRLGVDTLNAVWDAAGRRPALTLMNCTTSYPTPMHEVHLRSMRTLADTFGCPVGLSDHSAGISAALASVALGATVIEKHFTLDRSMPGPDHAASLDPAQLKALVAGVREVEQAMGSPVKERRACEADLTNTIRRSLVAVRDIAPGETIAADMLVALRPEDGIPARDIDKVVGRPAWRAFAGGEVLRWDGAEAS